LERGRMSDLISRDEVNNAIKRYFHGLIDKHTFDIDVVDCSANIIKEIDKIPNAYSEDEVRVRNNMNCRTGSYSQLSTMCQACEEKDTCQNKRLEAVAYIIPNTQPVIEHSVNLNVGNQYVNTEDIAKAINKSFGLKMNCGFER
jgi:hypothetical protein